MYDDFKNSMMLEFDLFDLGRMRYFLEIKVVQSLDGICMSEKVCSQNSSKVLNG